MPKKAEQTMVEAPEKQPSVVRVTLPLNNAPIGVRAENTPYITRAAFDKGMQEYLSALDSFAYIYQSPEEFRSIFNGQNDNDAKSQFIQYAVDRRRILAEVVAASPEAVILRMSNADPALVDLIQNHATATLRFYWNSKKTNQYELKKGTHIHIIEVSVIIIPPVSEGEVIPTDPQMTDEIVVPTEDVDNSDK